jgi:TetR/AcrR family transcriptional regulator, tetracycline repressor protein
MTVEGRQARRGSPAGVTRDRVVEVALELLEADGPDALTMRGLAAKLGVAPTAIYWHVGDKQALLDAVVDHITADVGQVEVEGQVPVERIASTARSLRRNLLERPYLIAVVHEQGRTAAIFRPARAVLARELQACGLDERRATVATEAVLHHVIGSVLIEQQVARAPAQRETPEHPVDAAELFEFTLNILVPALVTGPNPAGLRAW